MKTVYICDACDKEFKDGFVFYGDVEIIESEVENTTIIHLTKCTARDICRSCMEKLFSSTLIK